MSEQDADQGLNELRALFRATDGAGKRRYPKEEIEDLIVWSALSAPREGELPAPLVGLIARFLARIAAPADAPKEKVIAHVQRYFRERPPRAELVQRIGAVLREASAQAGGTVVTRRMADLLQLTTPGPMRPAAPGAGRSALDVRLRGNGTSQGR